MKDYEGLCNQNSEVLLESLPLSRGEGLKNSYQGLQSNNKKYLDDVTKQMKEMKPALKKGI